MPVATLLSFRRNAPAGFLLPPAPLNWFALEHEPLAQLVKVGRGRKTWRVQTEAFAFYVKVFEPAGPWAWAWLKRLVGVDGSQREWRTLCRAAARGVAVPQVVSLCMHDRKGRSAFVTEEIAQARSLAQVWTDDVGPLRGSRRTVVAALAEAVARAFAEAHAAGFVHRDAHPNNILIQGTQTAGYRAVFVDVRGAHLSRGHASLRRAAHSLAQLDHYFRTRASRAERIRFVRTYLARVRRWTSRELFEAVARQASRHAVSLARQRDRRLRGDGKYFTTIDLGHGYRATVALKLSRRHAFPEPDVPDRTPSEWLHLLQPLAADGTQPDAGPIFVEQCAASGWIFRLRWTLRGSPARREFLRCHRLRHRDVPSDLILGYVEHRNAIGLIDRAGLIRPGRARP